MGSAKEAMIVEEDRLRQVEWDKENQQDLLDQEYEYKEAEKDAVKEGVIYWTVTDYSTSERLGVFPHVVQESTVGDYLRLSQFVYDNLTQLQDKSENGFFSQLPIFHSLFRDAVEAKAKETFRPDVEVFVFSHMTQTEDEDGIRLVAPELDDDDEEKNMVVQTNDEYDNDQFLISQQASEIERLTKEIAELKK